MKNVVFVFHGFLWSLISCKSKKWKQMEKQMLNNALIEWKHHCIYALPTMSSLLLLAWEKGFKQSEQLLRSMDDRRNIYSDPIVADTTRNDEIVQVLCILFQDSSSFLLRLIIMDESSTREQTLLIICPRTIANASPGFNPSKTLCLENSSLSSQLSCSGWSINLEESALV